MAAKEKKQNVPELLKEMKTKGIEQTLPDTGRVVRLRTLDASTLLREGKMPDELTPLVVRSVYQELADSDLRAFLEKQSEDVKAALAHLETLDFVVAKTIMDGTKVGELTLGEKRWIFRLVMGPTELLATFRYVEDPDVGDLDTGEDLPSATE